jgi:hypothetical protein
MSDFFTDLLAEVEAEMNYQDTNNLIDARERVQNRLQWRSFQQQHRKGVIGTLLLSLHSFSSKRQEEFVEGSDDDIKKTYFVWR